VPIWLISTSSTPPGFIHSGGLRLWPTLNSFIAGLLASAGGATQNLTMSILVNVDFAETRGAVANV
jgi:hypothetical protein